VGAQQHGLGGTVPIVRVFLLLLLLLLLRVVVAVAVGLGSVGRFCFCSTMLFLLSMVSKLDRGERR
jgi:hypothetical protein